VAVFANASAEFMMAAFAVFGGLLDVLMPQWIQANQRHPAAEVLVTVSSAGLESWLDVAALGPLTSAFRNSISWSRRMRESSCVALLVFRFSGDLISRIPGQVPHSPGCFCSASSFFLISHKHSNRV